MRKGRGNGLRSTVLGNTSRVMQDATWGKILITEPKMWNCHNLWNIIRLTSSKVSVDLYSTSPRSASNALLLPVGRRWSAPASPFSQAFSITLRDHWYALVYHVICLFNPLALPGTHSSLPQRAGSGWVGLGALVLRRGGLPVYIRSPILALTGPSVE